MRDAAPANARPLYIGNSGTEYAVLDQYLESDSDRLGSSFDEPEKCYELQMQRGGFLIAGESVLAELPAHGRDEITLTMPVLRPAPGKKQTIQLKVRITNVEVCQQGTWIHFSMPAKLHSYKRRF